MNIKTILIDDEYLAVAELQNMLKKFVEIDVIDTALDAEDAVRKIKALKPQLIFLDINMPGKTGFEMLEELEVPPNVVFVTAYDEYAIKAFEVNALDYILKPVNEARLADAVDKIKNLIKNYYHNNKLSIDKRIFIKDGDQCFFVHLEEIYLIESVGNYARVYFQNKKPLLHKSLVYLENKLPESHFFRTGRQYIINMHFIKNINPSFNNTLQVEMHNDVKVEISQRQSVKFKEKMGI